MTVVGAGVIGVEYASMFGALGTKVTVVDQRDRALNFLDGEIGEAFQYLLRRRNVTFRLREKVEAIESVDGRARASSSRRARRSSPRPCSTRSAARARRSASASRRTGLEADKRGRIKVDDDFRTSVPHIFAVGDVAGGGLAATAMEQGRIAALHAFDQPVSTLPAARSRPASTRSPRSAWSARTEEELTDSVAPVRRRRSRAGHELARGLMTGDEDGMLKLLVEPGRAQRCSACT